MTSDTTKVIKQEVKSKIGESKIICIVSPWSCPMFFHHVGGKRKMEQAPETLNGKQNEKE